MTKEEWTDIFFLISPTHPDIIRLIFAGMKIRISSIIFLICLSGVAFLYNYHNIFFYRPQSVHKWRQSDCASIALNYYQQGMRFFHPETHNLTSDGGTSGKCFTSEIPLLYFAAGGLYTIFGYHEYLYRILNTLLFFLGLFYLFRIFRMFLPGFFWPASLTLLFFTSPVLIYYGNNFLSNTSSLAFALAGWYYFLNYLTLERTRCLFISLLFFLLAAALKITSLISLIAISVVFILEKSGLNISGSKPIFRKPGAFIYPFLFIMVFMTAWLYFVRSFNQEHECFYFSTTVFPVWSLEDSEIQRVIKNVRNIWYAQYYHPSVFILLLTSIGLLIFQVRKTSRFLLIAVLLLISGTILYILLQFMTFADHDYYVIDLYILPAIILITTADLLNREYPRILHSRIIKVMFTGLLVFNINYGAKEIRNRYGDWIKDRQQETLFEISTVLRENGISWQDTVISVPDGSHVSLYLMNLKGWTEFTDPKFNRSEWERYNQDSAGIQQSIAKGASFLIINGISEVYYKPYLQYYCKHLVTEYKGVMVFDLRKVEKNFILPDRVPLTEYFCDAEIVDSSGLTLIDPWNRHSFGSSSARSDSVSHSGRYSLKTDLTNRFAFTIKPGDLKAGESFLVNVWRYAPLNDNSTLAATVNEASFYLTRIKSLQKDESGWEEIAMEFFITPGMEGHSVTIYAFNPGPDPVYFDDFRVIRYKSVEPQVK